MYIYIYTYIYIYIYIYDVSTRQLHQSGLNLHDVLALPSLATDTKPNQVQGLNARPPLQPAELARVTVDTEHSISLAPFDDGARLTV